MTAAPTALLLACAFTIATNTITKHTMNCPHMMGDSIDMVTTHNENPRQSESSSNLHVETNAKAAAIDPAIIANDDANLDFSAMPNPFRSTNLTSQLRLRFVGWRRISIG